MAWVAGIDGCRGGWFVVLWETESETAKYCVLREISEISGLPEKPHEIAVDIPIGLLAEARRGGRDCDSAARKILGPSRGRSVFSPPVRAALNCKGYSRALRVNRASSPDSVGISRQCFALFPKISEADTWIVPKMQKQVREVHPELCFFELNRRRPMSHSKKSHAGLEERKLLIVKAGFGEVIKSASRETRRRVVASDDILDACAACWTAKRIFEGVACSIPALPVYDSTALRMEMVY